MPRAENIVAATSQGPNRSVSGGPPNSRRLRDAVLLEDLRCDGSGHGGCQAGCRIYWKESWLRRVQPGSVAESSNRSGSPLQDGDLVGQLEELTRAEISQLLAVPAGTVASRLKRAREQFGQLCKELERQR